ncbi:MAG: glycosyltransferase family 4 protein [Pseudonocardiales bacterium]
MTRTLVVTNDFPPRAGGIQTFVHSLVAGQPAGSVVVYASSSPGFLTFDAAQNFQVVRYPGSMLLPTRAAAREVAALARTHGCRSVLFGAAAPLGLLAPSLRASGIRRLVALTHGHEVGWAALPGARTLLRRIGAAVDVVTYLGEYTRTRLAGLFGPAVRLERLAPGVDTSMFSPAVDGSGVRAELGLAGRPVVVCVSRLVPRKGQDTLIRALPLIRSAVPDAALLLVGGGPDQPRLQRLAVECGVPDDVVFTGSVPWPDLPAYYAAGDVFAMPCRTRRRGLDVEGLGMVYLEASATGLPVVAGDSGGAPDAVVNGETGFVVPGRSVRAVADRVTALLSDPALARGMGKKGRAWVEQDWRWDTVAARLGELLAG